MATQEGIEIIIKAKDEYSKSIDKIKASNELFGKSIKNTEKEIAALTKLMVAMRVQGIEPTDQAMVKLKNDYTKLTQSLNSGEGAVKKTNMQFTNLALVVQDLPYGFRGIQNNLPALLGGIAGVGGAAYLAFSAIIAGFTFWDEAQRKATSENKKLKESQDEFADSLNKSTSNAYQEIASINSLIEVAKNQSISMDKRLIAVKKLQDEYPAYFGNLSKEKILNGDVSKAIDGVTVSLLARAKASAIESKIGEMAAQDLADSERKNILQDENNKLIAERIKLQNIVDPGEEVKTSEYILNNYDKIVKAEARLAVISGIVSKNTAEIDTLTTGINNSILKQINLQYTLNGLKADAINLDQEAPPPPKKTKIDPILEAKIQEGKDIMYIADKNTKEFEDNERKAGQILIKLREQISDSLLNINKKFVKDDLDIIQSNTRNALKANRGRFRAQIQILKEAGEALQKEREKAIELGVDVAPVDKALQENSAALQAYANRWTDTSEKINNAVESMLEGGIATFAENLGKALAGEKVDLFGGFLELLSSGLQEIGKALIAYGVAMEAFKKAFTNPFAAIGAGIALIAAAALLKSKITKTTGEKTSGGGTKKFANGGIISGPTYGLMGEYPGASSNPEVVAPLDKLKDMIGGGEGGTFVLKGQDLLLSVNRAQKASNIKGQNISLA